MIKLIFIILISISVILILKQYRPEFAFMFKIAVVLLLVIFILPMAGNLFSEIEAVFSGIGIEFDYIVVLIKIIGISILSQLASEICRDSGESALASKIEFVSKIVILGFSLPFVKAIIQICAEFMAG